MKRSLMDIYLDEDLMKGGQSDGMWKRQKKKWLMMIFFLVVESVVCLLQG
jgi:hypothetical protein